jgi:uncharacterized protein (DUF2384 family)
MTIVFLDTEFTDLLHPELLSLGIVTLDGSEHYVELDMSSEVGRARRKVCSDFVKFAGVLDQFGYAPHAVGTAWEIGRWTGAWLLRLADESGTRVEVAFDYATDYELMEHGIRHSGLWDRVREAVLPTNVNALTGTIDGEMAAEECYQALSRRGLQRHHALADALALRAAYVAVKGNAMSLTRFVRTDDFRRLVKAAGGPAAESWTRQWLLKPAFGLGRRPIDIVGAPGGIEVLEEHLGRMGNG